jgi:hypothetical protein
MKYSEPVWKLPPPPVHVYLMSMTFECIIGRRERRDDGWKIKTTTVQKLST